MTFEIIICPKCNSDRIYFQETGSRITFRCNGCGVIFRETKETPKQ